MVDGRERTEEEIVGVRVGAANLEKLHQIVELAVDVSTHGDGAFLEWILAVVGKINHVV